MQLPIYRSWSKSICRSIGLANYRPNLAHQCSKFWTWVNAGKKSWLFSLWSLIEIIYHFRLSSIDNRTFSTFPELSHLNLAGNRFTATLRKEFFGNNQYLSELWLGDNPWRCECDRKSHEFFAWLTERPARVNSNAYGSLNNINRFINFCSPLILLAERSFAITLLLTVAWLSRYTLGGGMLWWMGWSEC